MKKQIDQKIERVELKPFMGMEPGLYLTLLYLIIIVIVLFLVGFLPGIIKSGKRITFISASEPVIVKVDGRYVGSAPITTFLAAGEHKVEYYYEGVATRAEMIKVGKPIFFSWLFPRKENYHLKPLISDNTTFRKYLEAMYREVVSWSAVTDFDERYHRPPLFGQVAATTITLPFKGYEGDLEEFFLSSLVHMSSSVMLEDFNSALEVLSANGFNSAKITEYSDQVNSLFKSNGGVFIRSETHEAVPVGAEALLENGKFSLKGYRYSDFFLAETTISEYLYALFIESNPYWAKGNEAQLVADGVADENYLKGVYPTVTLESNRPIRNISYYAAEAFTQWLSKESGKHVTLPTEAQWEKGAASVRALPYVKNLSLFTPQEAPFAMFGGYWEMTSTNWEPLAYLLNFHDAWQGPYNDIVVKGGSILNDPADINLTSAGVIERDSCLEYVSFRVIWTDLYEWSQDKSVTDQ